MDPALGQAQKEGLLNGMRAEGAGTGMGPVLSRRVYRFFTSDDLDEDMAA